ncbi:MAG: hypothetical protein H7A52_05255 [Akkermansiaceae bacterium]|nr:hypothetical protein [Akkermansiaceae bacterium]
MSLLAAEPAPVLTDALLWLGRNSLGGAALIVAGLLLFRAFPRAFDARWRAAFGFAILARLVLPLAPESRFSAENLLPSADPHAVPKPSPAFLAELARPAPAVIPMPEIPELALPPIPEPAAFPAPLDLGFVPEPAANQTPASQAPAVPSPSPARIPIRIATAFASIPLVAWLAAVWLAGAAGLLLAAALRAIRLARWIRHRPAVGDMRTLRAVAEAERLVGLKPGTLRAVIADGIPGAAVFGWRRPVLLISPEMTAAFSDTQLRGVLLHELSHIRRHDVLWNWLAHLVLALHWFNPLVWLAVRHFRADREQLCDELALGHLPPPQRRAYGEALLSLLQSLSIPQPHPARTAPSLAPFLSRKNEIKQRIAMISNRKKPLPGVVHALAAAFFLGAVAVTFTSALGDEERRAPEREREPARSPEAERGDRGGRHPEADQPGRRPAPEAEAVKPRRAPEEGAPRDGDRPRPEGVPRDGDRTRPEGAPRDGDRPRPEGAPRDGDRPRPEGAPRDGDRPRPEGAPRDGDRPRPEGAPRDGDRLRNIERLPDSDGPRPLPNVGMTPEAAIRIRHLHEAAENLERAGLPNEARQYREKAAHMEAELRARHAGEPGPGNNEDLRRHAENLEREVARLREMVGDLQNQLRELQQSRREGR